MFDHAARLKSCYAARIPDMRRMAYTRDATGFPHADDFIVKFLDTHLQQINGVNLKQIKRLAYRARKMLASLQGRPWKRIKKEE